MTNLAEDLLLLVTNDVTGRTWVANLQQGTSGAMLMDLVLAGRIAVTNKRVVVTDPAPLSDPLLNDALSVIVASSKQRRVSSWLEKLPSSVKKTRQRLVEQGLVEHHVDRFLGVIPVNRYVPTSTAKKHQVVSELEHLVDAGNTTDAGTICMATLLVALETPKVALPDRPRRQVRRGLKNAVTTHGPTVWRNNDTPEAVSAIGAAITATINARRAVASS